LTTVSPEDMASKVIVEMSPWEVFIPAEGNPPRKLMVPLLFEKLGGKVQVSTAYNFLVGVTTCNLSGLNLKSA